MAAVVVVSVWEFVTRELPFAGLHHGEVIHKVVTQDLRPGPWPRNPEQVQSQPCAVYNLCFLSTLVNVRSVTGIWQLQPRLMLATCTFHSEVNRPAQCGTH